MAQPEVLHQELQKHLPQGSHYEHETTWQLCLIAANSTRRIVDMVLVDWKQPELTNNELK